jgi:Arabinose-binding domain of AraC transcription regulator, N-term
VRLQSCAEPDFLRDSSINRGCSLVPCLRSGAPVGEVSNNPAIGLQLGTESKTERFHPVGLAALSSENLGSAIDRMARYKQLTCPEEILQQKDDEEWRIQFRWLLADEVEPPVLIECAFAWVLSIARHGTGIRLSPLRLEFLQPRQHLKTIERHFDCLRSSTQRDCIPCRRRTETVRHSKCRAPGHACATV